MYTAPAARMRAIVKAHVCALLAIAGLLTIPSLQVLGSELHAYDLDEVIQVAVLTDTADLAGKHLVVYALTAGTKVLVAKRELFWTWTADKREDKIPVNNVHSIAVCLSRFDRHGHDAPYLQLSYQGKDGISVWRNHIELPAAQAKGEFGLRVFNTRFNGAGLVCGYADVDGEVIPENADDGDQGVIETFQRHTQSTTIERAIVVGIEK